MLIDIMPIVPMYWSCFLICGIAIIRFLSVLFPEVLEGDANISVTIKSGSPVQLPLANTFLCLSAPPSSLMVVLSVSGLVQSFIAGPMELAKTQMQMQGLGEKRSSRKLHRGTICCLKSFYKYGGLPAVCRGIPITPVRRRHLSL